MSDAASSPASTVAELQRQLQDQQAENARLAKHNQSLKKQYRSLERKTESLEQAKRDLFEQLRLLIENRFGPSSEKYRIEQADMFFNEAETLAAEAPQAETPEDEDDAPTEAGRCRRQSSSRGGRVALPPELPRVDVVHDLEEAEQQCPNDGAQRVRIGEEVTEQLDVIPARVQVIRHIRPKYACRQCEDGVAIAPAPAQPLPKSNASANLLAYCLVAKYVDALPLYRQQQAFKRLGVELPRNTLARWMIQASERMASLIERLREHLRTSPVIHMDETTVQVNDEQDREASATSYMWLQRGSPPEGGSIVLFDYRPSRAGRIPIELLGQFQGVLVTDGYEGYAQVARQNGLTHAGCWAHARRKFVSARKVQPKGKVGQADKALKLIRRLYTVEQQARTLSADQRLALRQQQSQPIIDRLKDWLDSQLHRVPPKTALGKALHYLSQQWPRLTRFLDDGQIPLDNNPAENAIRPFVIGRKNWLFSDTPKGADASARIYSLIETAKANGLEPYEYMVKVLSQLPTATTDEQLDQLLPWRQEGAVTA